MPEKAKKLAVMLPPKCLFNSKLPSEWAKFIKAGAGWNAMTVPIANNKPTLIYFEQSKDKVSEKLAAEEYRHAEQAFEMGAFVWYLTYQYQLKNNGYDKAPLELDAKAAGKRGLDTLAKQSWWKNA